jgi:hypothetical protein
MTEQTGKLAAKMVRIMADVTNIEKNARNNFHNYQYASDVDVYRAVRQAMVEHNVAVFTKMPQVQQMQGTKQLHTLAQFVFVLVDADSGEREECEWYGEGDDKNDKGVNKSATAALKYFLLKTFVIPTGDDPDGDEPPQQSTGSTPPPPRSKRLDTSGAAHAHEHKPDKRTQQDAPAVEHWGTQERVTGLVNKASAYWTSKYERAQNDIGVRNRLSLALNVRGDFKGNISTVKLAELIRANYTGDVQAAWSAVEAYESA